MSFIKSSKVYSLGKYTGNTFWSWNNLVADYFSSRTAASKEAIDLRPVLNMLVQRGTQGLRFHGLEEMVCLQRCADTLLEKKQEPQLSKPPTKSAARPPMKKRKLATNSTALADMM